MLFDFLVGLLEERRDAGPLLKTTSIITLVAIVTVPAGLVVAWYRRGVTHLKDKNVELTRESRELRRARETLSREVDGLGRQTIPGLVEGAALERRDGNEERAISLVRGIVDHDAAALGPLCRAISSWLLSMVEGDPPGEHRNAAERFATLAVHQEPGDGEAILLHAEINARMGEAALRASAIDATRLVGGLALGAGVGRRRGAGKPAARAAAEGAGGRRLLSLPGAGTASGGGRAALFRDPSWHCV